MNFTALIFSANRWINLFSVLALILSGTLVRNELAIGFFVHPQLWKQDNPTHAALAKPLAKVLGVVMPFWYALTLFMSFLVAVCMHVSHAPTENLIWMSCVLWLSSVIFSITLEVPINNKIGGLDLSNLPANWKNLRSRWDKLHFFRYLMILGSLTLLTIDIVYR